LRFSSFKDVYCNAGKGTHSCNVRVAGSVGMGAAALVSMYRLH